MIDKRIRAAVLGALLGDATSLGYHWIYDTAAIPQGDKTPLLMEAPRAKWHNASTTPGSFTHYGVQAVALMDSLVDPSTNKLRYDLDVFWSTWKGFWAAGNTANELYYRDGATKNTLGNIETKGDSARTAGSDSHDFSVVGRVIAPLLLVFGDSDDKRAAYLAACVEVASVTHKTDTLVLAAVEFFAGVLFSLARSTDLSDVSDAIKAALRNKDLLPEFREAVEKGVASAHETEKSTIEIIAAFGPACSAEGAIPSTVHILVRYDGNITEGLKRNIASGGDNAARGSVVGSILGAASGSLGEAEGLVEQLRAKHPAVARLGL